MCGFVIPIGPSSNSISVEDLEKSSGTIKHRGPDNSGFARGNNWAMAFNRLSILDTEETGDQPMWDISKRYVICLNGEIYNYLELARQYLSGFSFSGASDTEILLYLLIQYKEKAIHLLNGMFAFCFIDTHSGEFIAGRDRLGVKPLYYYYGDNILAFASELKALTVLPTLKKSINENALTEYLFLKYISADQCIFNNFHKLKQGHYLTGHVNLSQPPEILKYWEYTRGEYNVSKTEEEWCLEFEELFEDAVDIRFRSDVPVGLLLSGGIDSGLVSAFSVRKHERKLKAYSVSTGENSFDESGLAYETAHHLGIDLTIIPMEASQLSDIDILARYYDEPFSDSSALPSFHVCKAAGQYGKVFLTGDGGDESFAGYKRYLNAHNNKTLIESNALFKKTANVVSNLFPYYGSLAYALRKAGSKPSVAYAFWDDNPYNPVYEKIFIPDLIRKRNNWIRECLQKNWIEDRKVDQTSKQQTWDYRLYLPDDILVKMDRASMANSIEIRSPFLDYRLIEWASTIPRSLLMNNTQGKLLLRKISAKYLPLPVQQAPKSGFGIPLNQWFGNKINYHFLKSRINDSQFALRHSINIQALNKLADLQYQNNEKVSFGELFWSLLMYDAWHKHYMA